MNNETRILIYTIGEQNEIIYVRLENGTMWMTQKEIAKLFQKGVNTINEHIKNILKYLDEQSCSNYFVIIKNEGGRKVKRRILHYNLDVIFNIAIRGQYFEDVNKLILWAKMKGIDKEFLTILPVKERNFGELLKSSLEGIVEIVLQYRVENYIVDFYIPKISLVIEYDEKHHKKQIENDRVRQEFIEKKLKVQFIRVNEGGVSIKG